MNQKYFFVVGEGYKFLKGCLVQMDILGRPINEFDTGQVIRKIDEWWYEVRNNRTGNIEEFHYKNLLPDKKRMEVSL